MVTVMDMNNLLPPSAFVQCQETLPFWDAAKIWPWKSLLKDMRVVKDQGHIWPWKYKGQGHDQG